VGTRLVKLWGFGKWRFMTLLLGCLAYGSAWAAAPEGRPALLAFKPSVKTASVIVTKEMRENAVRNCGRYAWARAQRDGLILSLKPFLDMSDEALWNLPPSPGMPRDNDVDFLGSGCPACGKKHAATAWQTDLLGHPWQVKCGHCGTWFPSNDFAAYYASAQDKAGKFHLGAGDKRFLQPREAGGDSRWVEDGAGVKIGKDTWFFAARYAFDLWVRLINVTKDLAVLYTMTGDPVYAHKCGVLLDRMADLYPEMDYYPFYRMGMEASTGGSGKGRVQGCIWETWTAQKLSRAYDYTFEALRQDQALVDFSSRMAQRYGTGDKSSPQKILNHIENHLVKEFIVGVLDKRIEGNPGMHQESMATAAIALDDPKITTRYLDWLFEPNGGQVPYVLVDVLSREGLSFESGIGYAMIPGISYFQVAELLRHYPAYTKHDLYRDFPKFRNCFTMCAALRALDGFSPNWGDSGKTMSYGAVTLPLEMALTGYRLFGGRDMAREVWFSCAKDFNRLRLDIYDAEPEAVVAKLKADLSGAPEPYRSFNSGGYGCAFLQAPERDHPRCLMLYYGRMSGHGHRDRLALQLVESGEVLMPDLGYPQYTGSWPQRIGWDSHVLSHNTVMVNDKNPRAEASYSGKTQLFEESDWVRVADVDGDPKIYEGVRTFRRCVVMVDVDAENSYALDLFWVRGGANHRLIQNAGGPEVTHSALNFVEQQKGTYAGENVEFGQFYDGPKNWDYDGTGFMYLKRVSRAKPAGEFWADWKIVEPRQTMPKDWEQHLRIHNLTSVNEAALCDGQPPTYANNPPTLRYLLRSRFGKDLSTQFVSVIEPYGRTPLIKSVRALKNEIAADDAVAAVEITLANGRRDVVLVREKDGQLEAGGVAMNGRVAVARFAGDVLQKAVLIEGVKLTAGGQTLAQPRAAITGHLAASDESDPTNTLLKLDADMPAEGMVGKHILFANRERSDASYRIVKVVDARTISIGQNSLAERLKDGNYAHGVINTIAVGDAFRIPMSVAWKKGQ
jgi:oligo-alginate lyase